VDSAVLTIFSDSIYQRIGREPTECLQTCESETIKAYLEWRAKSFRVKKESTMKSYWKRLSCGYIDATGRRTDNGTELDIRDVGRYHLWRGNVESSSLTISSSGFRPT
jgi:hypothetical protein